MECGNQTPAPSAHCKLCCAAWALCLTSCSYEHRRCLAGHCHLSSPTFASGLFSPSFLLHLELATYVPGNFQGGFVPYTLSEVMPNDLDTYWDFPGLLRSTVSEQKDAFAFSCPMQAGLQPQVLAGGLWLSGETELLPAGSDPFTGGFCSFPSLVPVSCSSRAGGLGQARAGTRGSDVSLSLFGVGGWVVLGVLGLDASETCITGRVLPAAAWPFMWSFFMWCTTTAALKACWEGRQKAHGECLAVWCCVGAAG